MRIPKKNIDYPYLILSFLLIYLGSNTLFTQIIFSTQYSAYFVFLLSVVIYFWNFRNQKEFNRFSLMCIVLLILSLFITLAINLDIDNFNGYFLIIMKIIGAYLLLKCLDLKRMLKAYGNIMVLLAVASLVVTYVFPMFSLEHSLPMVTNRLGVPFYNAFLAFKINSYGTFAIRNYGIFSEPAIYCFYLFLGALFIYSRKKVTIKNSLYICILAITMLTTFSPIGMITAGIVFLALIVNVLKSTNSMTHKALPFVFLFITFILFATNTDMRAGFDFMLSKAITTSESGVGRLMCLLLNITEWLENPLFGGGLKKTAEISSILGFNTSTTGTMLSSFGTLFAGIVTFVQFKSMSAILKNEKTIVVILFFIMFLLQINNHGLIQADWFWTFTMIGVVWEKDEASDNDLQLGEYAS